MSDFLFVSSVKKIMHTSLIPSDYYIHTFRFKMNSKVVTTILVITVTVSGIFGQEASSAVSSSSSLSSNAAPVAPKMSPAQLAMMRSAMTRRKFTLQL